MSPGSKAAWKTTIFRHPHSKLSTFFVCWRLVYCEEVHVCVLLYIYTHTYTLNVDVMGLLLKNINKNLISCFTQSSLVC